MDSEINTGVICSAVTRPFSMVKTACPIALPWGWVPSNSVLPIRWVASVDPRADRDIYIGDML